MSASAVRQPGSQAATRTLIELAGVEKVYRNGKLEYAALRGIDLSIPAGEMVAIVGPSGSGKSTIINMITGIDRPTAGTVIVGGERIDALDEERLASWRGQNVGIVFQFFQLLPSLTALENAVLPLDFARRGAKRERFERPRTSNWSVWGTSWTIFPPSSPGVSSSGSRSPARWRVIPR
jgi:ABC-type lipoprotein export system ATPase subunit